MSDATTHANLAKGYRKWIGNDTIFSKEIAMDRWVRFSITFNFMTGKLKQYLDGEVVGEQK
mgnify:FL=1